MKPLCDSCILIGRLEDPIYCTEPDAHTGDHRGDVDASDADTYARVAGLYVTWPLVIA